MSNQQPGGKGSTWAAFAIAMGFALAISGGALVTTIANDGIAGLTSATGLGRAALALQQQRQGQTIATLEGVAAKLLTDVDFLEERVETVAKRFGEHTLEWIAKIDAELSTLKTDLAALQAAKIETPEEPSNLLELRSSLDELAATRRRDLAAINKRIERLEALIARGEVTSGIPQPGASPLPPAGRRALGKVTPAAKEQVPDFVREADTFVATKPAAPDQGHIFDLLRKPETPKTGM